MKKLTFMLLGLFLGFFSSSQNLNVEGVDVRFNETQTAVKKVVLEFDNQQQFDARMDYVMQIADNYVINNMTVLGRSTIQTNITNYLVNLNNSPNLISSTFGCCVGDPANADEQDESLCVEQHYYFDTSVTGNFTFNADFTVVNCVFEVRGGFMFVVNSEAGYEFLIGTDFCPATLLESDNSRFFESIEDSLVLSTNEYNITPEQLRNKDYTLYTYLGQRVLVGNTGDKSLRQINQDLSDNSYIQSGVYIIRIDGISEGIKLIISN